MADNKAPNKNPQTKGDDFSDFVDEQIGFAPYWVPEEGKAFYGALIGKDERDLSRDGGFVRYTLMSMSSESLECQSGPNTDKAEKVMVAKGEAFNVSVYHQLAPPFDFYLQAQEDLQIVIPIRVICEKKMETKAGRDVWKFRLQIPSKTKAQLDKYKREQNAQLTGKAIQQLEG
jgi:hypothetical protein